MTSNEGDLLSRTWSSRRALEQAPRVAGRFKSLLGAVQEE